MVLSIIFLSRPPFFCISFNLIILFTSYFFFIILNASIIELALLGTLLISKYFSYLLSFIFLNILFSISLCQSSIKIFLFSLFSVIFLSLLSILYFSCSLFALFSLSSIFFNSVFLSKFLYSVSFLIFLIFFPRVLSSSFIGSSLSAMAPYFLLLLGFLLYCMISLELS